MAKLINLKIFSHFFRSSSAGGIILLICVIISLFIANSGWSEGFKEMLNFELGFNISSLHLKYPVLLWINDGLMAIFFLLVGLEIKREIIEGNFLRFPRHLCRFWLLWEV